MKISFLLNALLEDAQLLNPKCLGCIVIFTQSHKYFENICLLLRNSDKSTSYFIKVCRENNLSDVQMAALVVIIGELEKRSIRQKFDTFLSRTQIEKGKWSKGMTLSYLLQKEVNNETVCESS